MGTGGFQVLFRPYKKMHHSFEDDDEDDENDKDWVPDKGMSEDNVLVVLNIIKADYNRVVEEIDDKSMNMGGRRNLEVTGMGNSKHASPTTIKVLVSLNKETKRRDNENVGA